MLAGRNFGCGSSRERAPKALREFGFRALIAPSYGGTFYNNCYRNGIVPVELPADIVQRIADDVGSTKGTGFVTVDVEAKIVKSPSGETFSFEAPEALRQMLLLGQDEIELTLSKRAAIERFRTRDSAKRPWAY
ncbi:3-isopropylmalate dehydratase small subunit 2 [Variovorax sp. WS11]|uniref:3-isopropylmalate dehydratase small subunit n=1 Tax=Variovorax sp. WS11 TaxID=1105204 RepID=UPI0013D94113|nr:hypothetical protein [Variovorax sp. WS11]NDZ18723.1 hypothetical protein [Variovorax sp. WS11]